MATAHPDIYGPRLGKAPAFVTLIVNWNNSKGSALKFNEYDGKYCAKEIFSVGRFNSKKDAPEIAHFDIGAH